MVEMKRIGILSLAKLQALIFAVFGLLQGLFVAASGGMVGTSFGAGFGLLTLVGLPIIMGGFGFIAGAVGAFVYNLFAGWVGGIEFEFEEEG